MATVQSHRTKDVRVRVPGQLFETYKMMADENGLSVSSVARIAMIDYVKKRPAGSEDASLQIVMGG